MTTSDRLIDSLRKTQRALNPAQVYSMVWEYSVLVAQPGPPVKIDCEVVDPETASFLPRQLVGIVLWPGPSGFVAVPMPGTIVRIGFTNGDPSKPTVQGLDPAGTPLLVMGFATLIRLGDQSAAPLTPTTWSAALAVDLTTFAAAMAAAAVGPLSPMAAPATALQTALGLLPPAATSKVLGT